MLFAAILGVAFTMPTLVPLAGMSAAYAWIAIAPAAAVTLLVFFGLRGLARRQGRLALEKKEHDLALTRSLLAPKTRIATSEEPEAEAEEVEAASVARTALTLR